jgi:serine/threonine protein kinase
VSTCIGDNTLVELVENSLSASEAKDLDRHFAQCADCRRRWAALAASPSRLAQAPTSPAGVGAHLDLAPGTKVGRFVISHEIGRGGMGVVFAARDPHLDRPVAIKFLHSTGGDESEARAQERLLAEARAMARLDHPNIIRVYEADLFRQETYIAMEMVHGETLSHWIKRWQRPWSSVLAVFRQAGSALTHAHASGLAHGDFKPENVLIDDADRVRVTDFGLSRWFEREGRPLPASDLGDFVGGTPRYMAPEQFGGQPANACSDQFGFCVALYESLYSRHPFAQGSARSLLELPDEQAMAPLLADARMAHRVPSWLHTVLARGLHRDPARRYPSMDALLDALTPRRARARWPIAMVAAGALLLVSGMSYALGALQLSPAEIAGWFGLQPSGYTSGTDPGHDPDHGDTQRPAHRPSLRDAAPGLTSLALGTAVLLWNAHAQFAPAGVSRAAMLTLGRDLHTLLEQEIQDVEDRLSRLRRWRKALTAWLPKPASDQPQRTHLRSGYMRYFDTPRVQALAHTNGLSLADIDSGLQPNWRDIQVCFREWRERQPYNNAQLEARVTILPSGDAKVQNMDFHDRVVRKCVSGAIRRSRFTRAPHSTHVDLAFVSRGKRLDLHAALVP